MDSPDLQITALPVDSQLLLGVVIASRAGPYLDDERQRLVVHLEDIMLVANPENFVVIMKAGKVEKNTLP